MTNQEIFNQVWNHFVVEKHPRSIKGNLCCYFNEENGAKCGVGCLFSDEEAKELEDKFGGSTIKSIKVDSSTDPSKLSQGTFDKLKAMDSSFLMDIQGRHDVELHTSMERFIQAMRLTADVYRLEVPSDQTLDNPTKN